MQWRSGALLILAFSFSVLTVACQGEADRSVNWMDPRNLNGSDALIGGQVTLPGDAGRNSVVMVIGPQKKVKFGEKADFSTCTGVLVAKNVILTAAHCLKPVEDDAELYHDGIYEDLGLISFASEPTKLRRIQRIIVHEEFQGQQWIQVKGGYVPRAPKDLALARFEGDAPAGTEIAKIPKLEIKDIVKHNFEIFGYGLSSLVEADRQERDTNIAWGRANFIKRTPLLRIERKAKYNAEFEYGFVIDQRDQPGICFGDSGGPAFIQHEGSTFLVGIHSHRTGTYKGLESQTPTDPKAKSDCQYFAVMTRTGGFSTWIQKNTETLQQPTCENEPLFRKRAADLFELEPKSLKVTALKRPGVDAYRVEGANPTSGRQLSFEVNASVGCRLPSQQGFLSRNSEEAIPQSGLLRQLYQLVGNDNLGLELHFLNDRIPYGLQIQPATLIRNLTGLFGWHPPDDGWIFLPVQLAQDSVLVSVPQRTRGFIAEGTGNPIMEALNIQSPELTSLLSRAVRANLRVFWLAYSQTESSGYNQEVWIRDPKTHEVLILRQSVRL